jgi:FeS assembly SUF system protein
VSDIKVKESAQQAVRQSSEVGADRNATADGEGSLHDRVIAALRTVFDPEIPVNIYDLGLIYQVDVDDQQGAVYVEMTLTSPGCPVAQSFPGTVEARLRQVEGIDDASVKLVWDPPWDQNRMSDAVKLQLGML